MDYYDLAERLERHIGTGRFDYMDYQLHHVAAAAIKHLLASLEEASSLCTKLTEAKENSDEACAKWEGLYRMALERAEKAEQEIKRLRDIMWEKGFVPFPPDD